MYGGIKMKRSIITFVLTLLILPVIAAKTVMYLSTEKKYAFTSENIAQTIPEFIEKEKKQEAMAKKWTQLMDPESGMVSVADLFEICRAGGLNTYRVAGYQKCREFIVKLIDNAELEWQDEFLTGYCPGLDENGKNPNALKSITDQTQVGDFCSSSVIYAGEVTFRKGYNCTCTAYACKPGYEIKSGRCVTIVADGQGNCLRKEFPKTAKVNTTAKAVEFCQDYATKNKCKLLYTNMLHSQSKIVCNPTLEEVDKVKGQSIPCPTQAYPETSENNYAAKCESFCKAKAKTNNCKYKTYIMQHSTNQCVCNPGENEQAAANLYKEVCGKDKGKTGHTEYCVEKFFNWVNVGQLEAAGLAQLYAKEKHGNTITCSAKYRTVSNDDYIACATNGGTAYYEFQFDDVVESVDADKKAGVVKGLALIYGGSATGNMISGTCTKKLEDAAKKFAMKATTTSGIGNSKQWCMFDYGKKIQAKDAEKQLNTIEGIDSYAFYHGIQIQGSMTTVGALKNYVVSKGYTVTSFECDKGYGRIKNKRLEGDDDILTCRFSGSGHGQTYKNKEIDFVFDDVSEAFVYKREAGESGIQCIVMGGKYQGSNCHGLNQEQCTQADVALKRKYPGCSGTVWENGKCVLRDARQEKTYDILQQAGIGLVAGVDCLVLTHTGCAILAVEVAGLTTEVTTDLVIGGRASKFLQESVKCKARGCAKQTIRTLGGQVLSVKSGLSDKDLHAVDEEFARLVEYLEPEDLASEVSASDWDDIVNQLGGDPNDTSGKALVIANKIGLVAQFASIGVSALRLTGKAIAKIAAKSAAKTTASGTKALTVVGSHTDDMARLANAADESYDAAASFSKQFANDFADIGVKEERTAAGGFRYRDTKTGKFVSRQEILERIYGKPKGDTPHQPSGGNGGPQGGNPGTGPETGSGPHNQNPSGGNGGPQGGNPGTGPETGSGPHNQNPSGGNGGPQGGNPGTGSESGGSGNGGTGSKTDSGPHNQNPSGGTGGANDSGRFSEELMKRAETVGYKVDNKATSAEEILEKWNLNANATNQEIKSRYRKLALEFHPDRLGSGAPDDLIKMVNKEWELIKEARAIK